MGQTVLVTLDTAFGDDITPASVEDLRSATSSR